ncbi:MAG: peptidoglycan DD-metalloendopeptidase family protein [Deltaproteobacteria bacterium]|nr:peptidoglycan DD-metalloendopeptidase family protein [Deltaproteobacteria bacterium]
MRASLRLGALFAALVGINVYVFFFRGGTSIRDVMKTSAIKGQAVQAGKTASPTASLARELPVDARLVRGGMAGHLGLAAALAPLGLAPADQSALVAALKRELNLRALRADQSFEAALDGRTGALLRFSYRISPISSVEVTRSRAGALLARKLESKLEAKTVRVGGRIDSSLNRALSEAGESGALVARFVELFSWDINWYLDPREGDEVRVVVEKHYHQGKLHRYGRILAAEYRGRAGRFQAYWHRAKGGEEGYYDAEGRSIRRSFLKTPLVYRRISSQFTKRRFHPVLHRMKAHQGVDYAAARGTPVWAASDGTVVSAKPSGGAGNMVVLRHTNGIATLYMHLDRIARGLKPGMKVKQRQVIGTVGMTGLATGPHLHYGVTQGGRYVDPQRLPVQRGAYLPGAERLRFLAELARRRAELEQVAIAAPGAGGPSKNVAQGPGAKAPAGPSSHR